MAKRKAPSSAWKPGQSGNLNGRPKIVQAYVGERLLLYVQALEEIALGKVIEYDLSKISALKGLKPEEISESVKSFEFRREADQIKALEILSKMADAFPSEKKEIKVEQVGLTEEQQRARLKELLALAAERAGKK